MEIKVTIPDAQFGPWRIETFEISETATALYNINCHGLPVAPGYYKKLTCHRNVIMSNTPSEISEHRCFIYWAKREGGHILINGLGLGVALKAILESDKVKSVTVIEISPYVIRLVAPHFEHDDRVEIIQADALEWKPKKGTRYTAVWHDIWPNICSDNLPEMHKLHRKYGRYCDWQASWGREACEEQRRRYG